MATVHGNNKVAPPTIEVPSDDKKVEWNSGINVESFKLWGLPSGCDPQQSNGYVDSFESVCDLPPGPTSYPYNVEVKVKVGKVAPGLDEPPRIKNEG